MMQNCLAFVSATVRWQVDEKEKEKNKDKETEKDKGKGEREGEGEGERGGVRPRKI